MATRLKNILTFTTLVAGIPQVVPHLLNVDGVGVIPDRIESGGGSVVITADATAVTVTSDVNITSLPVYVEYWYSPERVFGTPSNPPFTQLSPAPLVTQGALALAGITVSVSSPPVASGIITTPVFDTILKQIGTDVTLDPGGFLLVNTAGIYTISYATQWPSNAVGERRTFLRSGNPPGGLPDGDTELGANTSGDTRYNGVTQMIGTIVNDIINVGLYQDSGGPLAPTIAILTAVRIG